VKPPGHPLDWHLHLGWYLAIVALLWLYLWAVRQPDQQATARQQVLFSGGLALVLAGVTWPAGDLAAHWSLMVLVLQRLLLMLAVPPLLIAGLPDSLLVRLTRPAPVDGVLRVATKPIPAIAIVTVISVGTLTSGAVNAAARTVTAQVALELVVLVGGFVLWAPVLSRLPGAPRISALGRGGYLIVQSIVPSFLSIVWIFARHSLYAPYAHRGTLLGMSPVLDQQVAGFIAKLSTIFVLWTVAYVIMNRGQVFAGSDDDDGTLVWSDVEREIERAERRERHHGPR